MNTTALNRLLKERGAENIWVCSECGSLEIQFQAWVDTNQLTYCGGVDDDDNDSRWCDECQEHVRFSTLAEFERKMDRDMDSLSSDDSENRVVPKEWERLPYLRKRETWAAFFREKTHTEANDTQRISALESLIRHATENISIDDLEDVLRKKGATSIRFVDEKIDDGVDNGEDEYIMLQSYDFVLGKYMIHGRFYYGNNTRTITCTAFQFPEC